MTTRLRTGGAATGSALALMLSLTGPALADVTPQDVWTQFRDYLETFGYTVTTTPDSIGADLSMDSLTMTMALPPEPGSDLPGTVTVTLGGMSLRGLGDGTVSVEMPASVPVEVFMDGPEDKDLTVKSTLDSTGFSMIASGSPDDIAYTFTAARMAWEVSEFEGQPGKVVTPEALSLVMEGMRGTTQLSRDGALTRVQQEMTLASMSYDIDISNPEPGKSERVTLAGTFSGLTSTADGTLPQVDDPSDLPAAIADGYAIDAGIRYAAGNGSFDFRDEKSQMQGASKSRGGSFDVTLSADGLAYDAAATGVELSLEGSQFPFPVTSTLAGVGFGLRVPVVASEDDQPFGASFKITELVLPEPLWSMVDPTNAFPHDPITAEIDLDGSGRFLLSFLSDSDMAELQRGEREIGTLSGMAIRSLLLKGAGATVAATADMTFRDFPLPPRKDVKPDMFGTADVRMTGVTGLLNKLAQMGLIPAAQAMMAAGMIQQIGKPEGGADDFSAKIEMTPNGNMLVNGMPMPFN